MPGSICRGLALESRPWHEPLSPAVPAAVGAGGMSVPQSASGGSFQGEDPVGLSFSE